MIRRSFLYLFLSLVFLFRLLPLFLNSSIPSYPSNPSNPLQQKLDLTFASLLPNNEAGLLSGIVLGTKKSLSMKLYEEMQQNGTLHIAVASGMNVTLLAGFLFPILTLLFKRKIALTPLTIMIWFYAFLTGFQPPIIRASIMVTFLYLAQELGRKADSQRILWLTGFVMVFVKPELIVNLGFQFSFLSMLGLAYVEPLIKSPKNIFLSWLAPTLACQIATLPLVMANFGEYNLLSPLVNLLILWTVPFILQIGLCLAFFSFFIRPISQLLAYLVYPLLHYFVIVMEFFSKLKFFQVWTPKWGLVIGIGYYLLIGWWVFRNTNRSE